MASIDDMAAKIAEVNGTANSVAVFVKELEKRIADVLSGVTLPPAVQAKLDAAFDELNKGQRVLAQAIDNDPNTPAPEGGGDTGGGDTGGGEPGDGEGDTGGGNPTARRF
jgi:hypothetical protein